MSRRCLLRVLSHLQSPSISCAASRRYFASDSSILSHSTILLQDGADITEIPLVIRRMDAADFPFSNPVSYSNSNHHDTIEVQKFAEHLRSCITIAHVLRLLEVPGENVTSGTAAFALRRICQLQQANAGEEDKTLVKPSVLHELCATVVNDLPSVATPTLTSLIRCALHFSAYDASFIDSVYRQIEIRVGDQMLSIDELCTLITILSEHPKADQNVVNNLWIHLGTRYQDVNHDNVRRVYETLQYLTPTYKYVLRILDKSLKNCWWKLQADDVTTILRIMTLCNHYSASTLVTFGRWLFMNIHEVNDAQLKDIVAAYDQFNFNDPHVVRALERYIHAKASRMDTILLGSVMEYFRRRRFLSPRVFDSAASTFEHHGDKYESREIVRILRPFGQLNYLPPNAANFFNKVEDVIMLKFSDFDPASLLELMASFVYLGRFPVNFLRKIFTPHFLAKCLALPDLRMQQQASRHLLELQAAISIEFPQHASATAAIDRDTLGLSLTGLGQRYIKFHQEVRGVLMEMFGPDKINHVEIPRNTPHLIDFEICVGAKKKVLVYGSSSTKLRLAIIGMLPEYYCVNTSHILGAHALRKRHLQLLDYTVIELHFEEFMWKHKRNNSKKDYITDILLPYIDFEQ